MSMLSSVPPASAQASGPGEEMSAREGSVAAQNGGDTQSTWTRPFHSFLTTTQKTAVQKPAAKNGTQAQLASQVSTGPDTTSRLRPRSAGAQSPLLLGASLLAPLSTALPPPVPVVSGAALPPVPSDGGASHAASQNSSASAASVEPVRLGQTEPSVASQDPKQAGVRIDLPALKPAPSINVPASVPATSTRFPDAQALSAPAPGSSPGSGNLRFDTRPPATAQPDASQRPPSIGQHAPSISPSSAGPPIGSSSAAAAQYVERLLASPAPASADRTASATTRVPSVLAPASSAESKTGKTLRDALTAAPDVRPDLKDAGIQHSGDPSAPSPNPSATSASQNSGAGSQIDLEQRSVLATDAANPETVPPVSSKPAPTVHPSGQTSTQGSAKPDNPGQLTAQDAASQQSADQHPSGQQSSSQQTPDKSLQDTGSTAQGSPVSLVAAAVPAAEASAAATASLIPPPAASSIASPIPTHVSLLPNTTQAERIQVVNQVAQQIQALHSANAPQPRTVTMQLHPDQWGPVTISVTTHGSTAGGQATVSAVVTTAHDDAQTLLRQNSQDLKDALSSAGLRLDKLDIQTSAVLASTGSHGADAHQQGQGDGQSGRWAGIAGQHGASPQAGSQGGQHGSPAFGQGQAQRRASSDADLAIQPVAEGGRPRASAASQRTGGIDLQA